MTQPVRRSGPTIVPASRTSRQQAGDRAERRALDYLVEQGCRPIAMNARGKVGELDLVVTDQQTLVFVEVRMRSSSRFGGAAASVGVAKQLRVRRAAELYLLRTWGHGNWPACRFDVIAIDGEQLNWIKNAF